MLPTLFIGHGAPTLPFENAPVRAFLRDLPGLLPHRPKAILVVSAHWDTGEPMVNAVERNETIHDFGGFPAPLYAIRYPAPGAIHLAEDISAILGAAGLRCDIDYRRGLDHGAWVPLMLMYPQADVPVLQLSVQSRSGPAYHLALGQALEVLREEDVLVLASGSFTHDLSEYFKLRDVVEAPEPQWVTAFADWFDEALTQGRTEDLLSYRTLAPNAAKNHPTEEHLLPLFVALGAAGADAPVRRLHASATHGVLRMDVYSFGGQA